MGWTWCSGCPAGSVASTAPHQRQHQVVIVCSMCFAWSLVSMALAGSFAILVPCVLSMER